MRYNVGDKERLARLAVGAAAGTAALATPGAWKKTALGVVAAAGVVTGLSRYCPINRAMGIGEQDRDRLGEGLRDTELRRETDTRAAMGEPPSGRMNASPASSPSNPVGSTAEPRPPSGQM